MLEVRNLDVRFGRHVVLRDVSFSVARGSVVGFLGPNGAGKSTTMRVLSGFIAPTGGCASIDGFDVQRQRARAQAQLGYVPEAAGGFGVLTPLEFLRFCGQARGLHGEVLRAALVRVCDVMDLQAERHRRMGQLSKGWRQRVWVAQALLHDPPALIMDEPTDGLDPNQKRQARALIRRLRPDKAILVSTHILEEAEEVCDRTVVIAAGRVVADDDTRALLDEHGRLNETFHRLTQSEPRPESPA